MDYTRIRQQAASLKPAMVTGESAAPLARYEAFRGHHDRRAKRLVVEGGVLRGSNIDISWLPAAAETYKISADPDDYVLVDVPIVTVDVPNRNVQEFGFEEISFFDPMQGRQIYKTFNGKACHVDHFNQDPLKAKGVHFDSSLEFIPAYGLYKIRVLTGWDRTKDRHLVEEITSGRRTGYSMGAMVSAFLPLVAGTRVTTARGLVPIESVRDGMIVETMGKPRRCAGAVFSGVQKVVTVKTSVGTEVTAALSHPFVVLKPDLSMRWRDAGNLKVGDYVGLRVTPSAVWPKELPFDYVPLSVEYDEHGLLTCAVCSLKFKQLQAHLTKTHNMSVEDYKSRYNKRVANGSLCANDMTYPKNMTPDLAALIGYYMAEGAFGDCGSFVGFSGNVNKPELWAHYTSAFRNTFGTDPQTADVRLGVKDFYRYIGLGQGYAIDKHVPWSILQAPRESVVAFLRAYWEGDGSAAGSNYITYYTISPQLARDVQLLLLRLGIASSTDTSLMLKGTPLPGGREHPYDTTMYRVRVFGASVDKHIEIIGATSDTRKRDLETMKSARNVTQLGAEIPFGLDALHDLYDNHKHGDRTKGNPYYVLADGTIDKVNLHRVELKDNTVVSYSHFDKWPDLLPNVRRLDPAVADRFEQLLDTRLFWVKVESVEESPIEQPVYCIKDVEEDHNFVAEGHIVHNCSVCGAMDTNTNPCRHMDTRLGMQKGALWDVQAGRRVNPSEVHGSTSHPRLVYQRCCGVTYFETSSVADPADTSAVTDGAHSPIWIP